MILSLRTDSPIAEIGLWRSGKKDELYTWEAGRQLSSQLLEQIDQLLKRHNVTFEDLTGIMIFRGPGSFTGLRIGATVANAIAYAKNVPIVGTVGEGWHENGLLRLASGKTDKQVIPEYGAPANVTKPK